MSLRWSKRGGLLLLHLAASRLAGFEVSPTLNAIIASILPDLLGFLFPLAFGHDLVLLPHHLALRLHLLLHKFAFPKFNIDQELLGLLFHQSLIDRRREKRVCRLHRQWLRLLHFELGLVDYTDQKGALCWVHEILLCFFEEIKGVSCLWMFDLVRMDHEPRGEDFIFYKKKKVVRASKATP